MSLSFRRTVASSVQYIYIYTYVYIYVYVYKSHQQNTLLQKSVFLQNYKHIYVKSKKIKTRKLKYNVYE